MNHVVVNKAGECDHADYELGGIYRCGAPYYQFVVHGENALYGSVKGYCLDHIDEALLRSVFDQPYRLVEDQDNAAQVKVALGNGCATVEMLKSVF